MSGITTIAVLAVVVVFGLPILGTYTGAELDANADKVQDKKDAGEFGNNPTPGDVVCGLYLKIQGELDENRNLGLFEIELFESAYIYIDKNNGLVYEWDIDSCYTTGGNSFIPLVAYNLAGDGKKLQQNAFLPTFTFGETFDMELTGFSTSGGGLLTAKSTEKRWIEEVTVKDFESVTLPISFTEEFFLHNVKVDNYIVEFRAIQQSINNEDTDKPISFDIVPPTFR
jgi:hypothetical protein